MAEDKSLDPSPELIVQAAYLQAFSRLKRQVFRLAGALVVLALVGGASIWIAITATANADAARTKGHNDTQQQIKQLACGLADQVPPGNKLADSIRKTYMCGPYTPPKARVQPKS